MHCNIWHWRRRVVIALAAGALSFTAGCAGTETAQWVAAGSGPSRPAPSGTAGATPTGAATPAPVALTGACPLLSAVELKGLLGGSTSRTTLTATEGQPDTSAGYPIYTCSYGSKGNDPFVLSVTEDTRGHPTPAQVIEHVRETAKAKTQTVVGVGDGAVFYTLANGVSVFIAVKQFQGKVRSVVFAAPATVPEQKFIDVDKLVLGRI
jgi:hypothetical protein